MTTRTWISPTYRDLQDADAWSPHGQPGRGDIDVMRHGYAYAINEQVYGALYAASYDARNPVWLYLQDTHPISIDVGLSATDTSPTAAIDHRYLSLYVVGDDTIQMFNDGDHVGGGGTAWMYLAQGATAHLSAEVKVNSALAISGPGTLVAPGIDAWRATIYVGSDISGAGDFRLDGQTWEELAGQVGVGTHIQFSGTQDTLTIDNTPAFKGWIDTKNEAGAAVINLLGIDATSATFAYDHLFLSGPAGTTDIHLSLPTGSGMDIWKTAGGVRIDGTPLPGDVYLWHAMPTAA